jgi:hypothetical protein
MARVRTVSIARRTVSGDAEAARGDAADTDRSGEFGEEAARTVRHRREI